MHESQDLQDELDQAEPPEPSPRAAAPPEPDQQQQPLRQGTKRPLEQPESGGGGGQDTGRSSGADAGSSGAGAGPGADAEEEAILDAEERSALLQDAQQSGGAVNLANLAWWTTDAEVEAACSEYGRVVS